MRSHSPTAPETLRPGASRLQRKEAGQSQGRTGHETKREEGEDWKKSPTAAPEPRILEPC